MERNSSLLGLPKELIHHISAFLKIKDFSALAASNSEIRKIIQADQKFEAIKLENVSHIRGQIIRFTDEGREIEIFKLSFGPNSYRIDVKNLHETTIIEILYDLNIWPDKKYCELNTCVSEYDMRTLLPNLVDCGDFSRNKIKFFYYYLATYQGFDSIRSQATNKIKQFLAKHGKIEYMEK